MSSSKRRRFPSPQTRSSGESRPGTTAAKLAPPSKAIETKASETPAPPITRGTGQQAVFELDRIGDLLRRARAERGEDFYTIAAFLRIRPDFLAALENSRYEELPADAYVTGFLRSYAAYLGLDSRAVIDQYRREMAGRRRRPQLNMPKPLSEGRAPTAVILIGATIAALLIYVLWYGLSTSNRAVVDIPPPLPQTSAVTTPTPAANRESVPALLATPASEPSAPPAATSPATPEASTALTPAITSAPAQEQTPAVAAKEPPAPTTARDKGNPETTSKAKAPETPASTAPQGKGNGASTPAARIVIKAEKESWILVSDSHGNTIFDKILKPGEVYHVPDIKGLTLTSGNGNGFVLSLDGVVLPHLASDSRLMRNVPLDPERLKRH